MVLKSVGETKSESYFSISKESVTQAAGTWETKNQNNNEEIRMKIRKGGKRTKLSFVFEMESS